MLPSNRWFAVPLIVLATACCKKGGDSAAADGTTKPPTPTTTPAAATTTEKTEPAKPPPLDDATKKKLVDLFEKNKVGIKRCDGARADLHKSIAAKDFTAVPAKSIAFNGCRRGWVSGLMPQISKIGPITEDQAVDEMMAWDLNRK